MNMATNGLDLAKYVLCGWVWQDGAAHAGGVYGLGCVFRNYVATTQTAGTINFP